MRATPRHFAGALRTLHLVAAFLVLVALAMPRAHAAGGTFIGKTITRIPGGDNYLTRALVQPDGKIVVVGAARFGTLQYQITRYNADGTLDASFATNGTILEPLGPGNGTAYAVALQSDGKVVVAGDVRSDRDKFGLARFSANGVLDLTFGGGGSAVAIGPGDAGAFAMVIQADGKIVLGGYSMTAASGGKKVFTLARYNTNDTIDTTFGTNGFVIAPAGTNDEVIKALGIQSDGKIVAAGTITGGGVRMMRVTTAGAIDGTWATPSVSYMLGAQDLVVQGDDSVAIAGNVNGGSVSEVGVLHMTAAGAVDTAFGNGACSFGACPGIAHMSISDSVTGYGIALQSGKYVVSGDTVDGVGRPGVALGRFTSTGAIDTTFGTSGSTVLRPTGSGDAGRALALRSDGRIIVAGLANGAFGDYDAMTVALTVNGALDTTFNATGFATLDVGTMPAEGKAAALQSDGKVVVAGTRTPEAHTGTPVPAGVLVRYLADGTLDTTFGSAGLAQFSWPAYAVAIQADGKIVVGGASPTGANVPSATFARYLATGAIDASFGSGGTAVITPATNKEQVSSIAIQADGRIVGAGFSMPGSFLDSLFVRLNTDGSLDGTFNGSGRATMALSTGDDEVNSVAIQPDGKIAGGGWSQVTGSQYSMAVMRLNANGTPDSAFGTSGAAIANFGTAVSKGYGLVLQSDGKLVLGGSVFNTSNSTDDFAIARFTTAGALDSSFGTGGMMSTDFGNHNRIFSLAQLPSGKLVGAGETGGFFALVQYLVSGSLDITFGTNGSTAEQINAGNDYANSIVIGSNGTLYVAGNGSGALALARFSSDTVTPTADLAVSQSASPTSVTAGQDVVFTMTVSNAGPSAASNVTLTDTLPAGTTLVSASSGCTGSSMVTCAIGTLASGASTSVQVTVHTSASGTITNTVNASASESDPSSTNNSSSASVTVSAAATSTLRNISTRGFVGTGGSVMIGGFIIGGSGSKTVIVTAAGPSLAQYGIASPLANPTIQLVRQSDGATIATNDNWGDAPNAAQIQQAGFAPANSLEPAIMVSLPPGAYTALISGVNGGTGTAIVAVYEVDHPEMPLTNISTRGFVGTGDNVMIGGFIIQGSASQTVAIVGTGPSLAQYGISNALSNPTLSLVRQSDGATIAVNDDWGTASNASDIQAAGLAPPDAREPAILVTLPPGAYTAVMSGTGGATGVGLIGVYRR